MPKKAAHAPTSVKTLKDAPKSAQDKNASQADSGSVYGAVETGADTIRIPVAFRGLFAAHRYKVFYGGRGAAKSWTFADVLLSIALERRVRVLCARELQSSIRDSVHKLLADRIAARGLDDYFAVTETSIRAVNGSEFGFAGLRHNAAELKSYEGVDICWVEEAHKVSADSWRILLPTIRKAGAEVWISFNPDGKDDPTWQMFVANPRPDSLIVHVTWRDNPFFTPTLEAERQACLASDPDNYEWIWEGVPRVMRESQIFNGRWAVEDFAAPVDGVRWYQGCDWGFGPDPSVLVRAYIHRDAAGEHIRVTHEAWQRGIALERLPTLFDLVPNARRWLIVADSARPELIKYMLRQHYKIKPAKKWPGSIQDGIAVLRSYSLVIHPRCEHTIEEMQRYCYKTDPLTGEIRPDVQDKDNHCVDSLRYAFDALIRGRVGRAA